MNKTLIAALVLGAATVGAHAGSKSLPTSDQVLSVGVNQIDLGKKDIAYSFQAVAGHSYTFTVDLSGFAGYTFDAWLSKGLDKAYGGKNDLFTFATNASDANSVSFTTKVFNVNKTLYLDLMTYQPITAALAATDPGVGGSVTVSTVPEPATTALFLAGLGALGIVGRRRKTQG